MPAVEITTDQLIEWLTRVVSRNRGLPRPKHSQRLMDQLAAQCLAEGEIQLGLAVVILHSLRVAGQLHQATEQLLELALDRHIVGDFDAALRLAKEVHDAN
jgi:hypothetical protein